MTFTMGILIIILLVMTCLFLIKGQELRNRTDLNNPNDFLLNTQQRRHITTSWRPLTLNKSIISTYKHEEPDPVDVDYIDTIPDFNYSSRDGREIPVDFIRELNQYNVSDLLLNFVDGGDVDYDEPFIRSRFGDYEPRNTAVIPKGAGCTPELTTIPLGNPEDPGIFYLPPCTKVERCSGCCSHEALSCQPTEVETLTFQVTKTQYTGAKKLKFLKKEIVHIDKHVKCKCDCKVKEENCNKYQEYSPAQCKCICTNSDEEKKCEKHPLKLWNSDLCACQCRIILPCTTDHYFDQMACKCVPNPQRRFANYNSRSYDSDSVTVTPLTSDSD